MEDDYSKFEGFAISPEFKTADSSWYLRLKELAKRNRQNPTEAESIVWDYLRAHFPEAKFRRQHIIGDYIVDFVSFQHRLVIEIDGEYHETKQQEEYDEARTKWLTTTRNLRVVRFKNKEVLHDIDKVISTIKEIITQ